MAKRTKTAMIVCAIAIGTGLLLSFLGFLFGGMRGFGAVENRVPWINLGAAENYTSDSYTFDAFQSMDVRCDLGKVALVPGDQYKVEVTYQKGNKPMVQVKGSTLVVRGGQEQKRWVDLGFLDKKGTGTVLKIYYPANAAFSSVAVANNLGDLRLTGLTAKAVNVEANLGNVVLTGVHTDSLTANLDMGSLEGSSLATKGLDAALNMGSLNLQGAFYGQTKAACSTGNCTISTSMLKSQYNIKTSVDLGNCQINGEKSHSGSTIVNNGAKNRMDLTCNMGNIKVTFK